MSALLTFTFFASILPTIWIVSVSRILISRIDVLKLVLVSIIALLHVSPWINELAYNKTWIFPSDLTHGFLGFIPVEILVIILCHTIFTVLWTTLCSHWTIPFLKLKVLGPKTDFFVRKMIPGIALGLIAWGWMNAEPETNVYYFASMIWWTMSAFILLWFFGGIFVTNGIIAFISSVLVPWAYFCALDFCAFYFELRSIDKKSVIGYYPVEYDFPVEEIFFGLFVTLLAVLLTLVFDREQALIDGLIRLPTEVNPEDGIIHINYLTMLTAMAFSREADIEPRVIADFETTLKYLQKSGLKIPLMISTLPPGIAKDFIIFFAFNRFMKLEISSKCSKEAKLIRFEKLKQLVEQIHQNREVTGRMKWKNMVFDDEIDWANFKSHFSPEEISIFRSYVQISYYLPSEPIFDIMNAFRIDLENEPIKSVDELKEYARQSTGAAFLLFTITIFHRLRLRSPVTGLEGQGAARLVEKTGQTCKLAEIARDIIKVSGESGRVYVPLNLLKEKEWSLLTERTPHKIPNERLRELALEMVKVNEGGAYYIDRYIRSLPWDCSRQAAAVLPLNEFDLNETLEKPVFSANVSLNKRKLAYHLLRTLALGQNDFEPVLKNN